MDRQALFGRSRPYAELFLFAAFLFGYFSATCTCASASPTLLASGSEDTVRIPQHPTLIRRMLASRLKRLPTTKPVLAASLVQFRKSCALPSCHFTQAAPKHPSQHLTFLAPAT